MPRWSSVRPPEHGRKARRTGADPREAADSTWSWDPARVRGPGQTTRPWRMVFSVTTRGSTNCSR